MDGTSDKNLCMGCMSHLKNTDAPCPVCGYDLSQTSQSPHQLKPNTILCGKYLVGRVLGEGGFGITYLGYDLNLDIKIAIKEYYPSGLVTRETTSAGTSSVTPFTGEKREYFKAGLEKFVNEAKSLAKFYTLPGIVAVKDFFRENETAYIVMEFVDGITLKSYVAQRGGMLPAEEVFALMRPLMDSLTHIHKAGIIHRDISPDNIMIVSTGVKLIDFGAARDFASEANRSMSVLLKPGYAPEEQYRTRGEQGPWTDVYALCATMYKCLTSETPPEALERIQEDILVPPSQFGAQLSQRQEAVLLKGMAVFRKNRYQNIGELFQGLYTHEPLRAPEIVQPIHPEIKLSPNQPAFERAGVQPAKKEAGSNQKNTILFVCAGIAAVLVFIIILVSRPDKETLLEASPSPSAALNAEATSAPEPVNAVGNTNANIFGGIAAEQGDWIYYRSNDNYNLYKVRKDGTERTKLNEDNSCDINVIGDWVYYYNVIDNEMYLYKIRTDGSERTKITEEYASDVHVIGDWIYFTSTDGIFKIKTDGTEQTKLFAGLYTTALAIVGDEIYFQDEESSVRNLYKMRIDGSNVTQIREKFSNTYDVIGDWIYYTLDNKLRKMRTDGTEDAELFDGFEYCFNIVGDWIYYSNPDGNLCKMRTDGSQKTILNNDDCYDICVVGDWVYSFSMAQGRHLRIRTDGTQMQDVEGIAVTAAPAETPVPSTPELMSTSGNTTGNVVNGGLAAKQGDWIYFANRNDSFKIYRMDRSGGSIEKLNDTNSWNLNVVGDFIYYSGAKDNNSLYRMPIFGGPEQKLNSDASDNVSVVDGWIYYRNRSDSDTIHRMQLDGSGDMRLEQDRADYINIVRDFVYFSNKSEGGRIYKMKNDGSMIFPITEPEVNADFINVADGKLYAVGDYTNGSIYSMNDNGDNDASDAWSDYELSSYLNVADGWIYFACNTDYGTGPGLYKTRIDGSDATLLVRGEGIWNINVAGDWVFYRINLNSSGDKTMFRMKTNGEANQRV